MQWDDVPETIDAWALAVAAPAWEIKAAAAAVPAGAPVGYYCDPGTGRVALHAPGADAADWALCKAAAARAVGADAVRAEPLADAELADPEGRWVKVAYSPLFRRTGELLNFFPGQYPGGLPNAPSPLAAMLTSGLVGAGLGWGTGKLLEHALPEGYGRRLGRTGAILGGLAGALPGAAWGAISHAHGHGLADGWPMTSGAGLAPGAAPPPSWPIRLGDPEDRARMDRLRADFAKEPRAADAGPGPDPDPAPVGARARAALAVLQKRADDAFGGFAPALPPTPADVDIDAVGRTLWDTAASPRLAAATMAALYAARQLPDPAARPRAVTGNQLGQLALSAAGNYAEGVLVGHALNAVVGTPHRPALVGGLAALGVIGAAIPRLFGH